MRSESEFLVDVLQRLNAATFPYMLTGSMASNYWGIPRTTHDLDFVVVIRAGEEPTFAELFAEGFFIQLQSIRSAQQPPHQFNVLDEQSALKADFWMLRGGAFEGAAFELAAFERRREIEIFATPAWLATAEDILLHKLYWNRLSPSERQLSDAAGVYAVQQTALDLDYLQRWAERLDVSDALARVLGGEIRPKST